MIKQAPMPVSGFWLFPVDAFGDISKGKFEGIRWGIKMVQDLTKHKPQLLAYFVYHTTKMLISDHGLSVLL